MATIRVPHLRDSFIVAKVGIREANRSCPSFRLLWIAWWYVRCNDTNTLGEARYGQERSGFARCPP